MTTKQKLSYLERVITQVNQDISGDGVWNFYSPDIRYTRSGSSFELTMQVFTDMTSEDDNSGPFTVTSITHSINPEHSTTELINLLKKKYTEALDDKDITGISVKFVPETSKKSASIVVDVTYHVEAPTEDDVKKAFDTNAKVLGFTKEIKYGGKFKFKGTVYTMKEIRPRAKTYPIVASTENGDTYAFPLSVVTRNLIK